MCYSGNWRTLWSSLKSSTEFNSCIFPSVESKTLLEETVISDCTEMMCCRREWILSETSTEHMQRVFSLQTAIGREDRKRFVIPALLQIDMVKGLRKQGSRNQC